MRVRQENEIISFDAAVDSSTVIFVLEKRPFKSEIALSMTKLAEMKLILVSSDNSSLYSALMTK